MPDPAPAVFIPQSGGAPPTAAGPVFVPTSGGAAPGLPRTVFVPTSGGAAPAAAGQVFVPTSGGAAPSAAGAVFVPTSGGAAPGDPSRIFTAAVLPNRLVTNFPGLDNDLVFTQLDDGPPPSVQFNMFAVAGPAVVVNYLDRNVVFTCMRSGGAWPVTANQVISAFNALVNFNLPTPPHISVALAAGNSGTGTLAQPTSVSVGAAPELLSPIQPPPAAFVPAAASGAVSPPPAIFNP